MSLARLNVINLYPCEPGFHTDRRFFPYHYLLYVHSGTGVYRIGAHTYPAAMGDMFYCPPGEGNTIAADLCKPFVLSGIEFTCGSETMCGSLPASCSLLSEPFLAAAVREMVQEYACARTDSAAVCDMLLEMLLLRLSRLSRTAGGRQGTSEAVLSYIRDNLLREVTYDELSHVFHYHKNSLIRLLKRETGQTLREYQISLRIRRATELLTYSRKTVNEIAALCGYDDASYFSRQYKQKTGRSPLDVRRQSHEAGRA